MTDEPVPLGLDPSAQRALMLAGYVKKGLRQRDPFEKHFQVAIT